MGNAKPTGDAFASLAGEEMRMKKPKKKGGPQGFVLQNVWDATTGRYCTQMLVGAS